MRCGDGKAMLLVMLRKITTATKERLRDMGRGCTIATMKERKDYCY